MWSVREQTGDPVGCWQRVPGGACACEVQTCLCKPLPTFPFVWLSLKPTVMVVPLEQAAGVCAPGPGVWEWSGNGGVSPTWKQFLNFRLTK